MSAFIVSEQTLRYAVSALVGNQPCEWGDHLGQQIWGLNAKAVACRYQREAEPMPPFSYLPIFPTPCEQLKALQCVIYQCSEGEEFENTTIYKQMRAAEYLLMSSIVTRLPEYEKAPWDR